MSFIKYLRRDSLLQLTGKSYLSRNYMLQNCRSLIIETAPPEFVKLNRLSGSDSGNFTFPLSHLLFIVELVWFLRVIVFCLNKLLSPCFF